MTSILLDIIKNGRFYKQLKYTKRGFPEIIEGKVTEVVDASDIRKFVEENLPSLVGKKYSIALAEQKTFI